MFHSFSVLRLYILHRTNLFFPLPSSLITSPPAFFIICWHVLHFPLLFSVVCSSYSAFTVKVFTYLRTVSGSFNLSISHVFNSFPFWYLYLQGSNGRDVKLTIHLHPAQMIRMTGGIPPFLRRLHGCITNNSYASRQMQIAIMSCK